MQLGNHKTMQTAASAASLGRSDDMVEQLYTKHDNLPIGQTSVIQRAVLRAFIDANGSPIAALCRAAGFPNGNLVYNYLGRVSNSLSLASVQKLDTVMPGLFDEWTKAAVVPMILKEGSASELTNALAQISNGAPVRIVSTLPYNPSAGVPLGVEVMMIASSGVQIPRSRVLTDERRFVGVPLTAEWADQGAFGVLVREPNSQAGFYVDGTVLVCVPPKADEGRLVAGRRVVLTSNPAKLGTTEVTVRELAEVEYRGRTRLALMSTPNEADPLLLPSNNPSEPWKTRGKNHRETGKNHRLAGLVMMACSPEMVP